MTPPPIFITEEIRIVKDYSTQLFLKKTCHFDKLTINGSVSALMKPDGRIWFDVEVESGAHFLIPCEDIKAIKFKNPKEHQRVMKLFE